VRPILVSYLLTVSFAAIASPAPMDSTAEFRAAGSLAMQGDMKSALSHLTRVQLKELKDDRQRSVATCMRERFVEKKAPPIAADIDPWAGRVLSAYRRYWTRTMLGTQAATAGERELAATLALMVTLPQGAGPAPGLDVLEPLLIAKLEARGYHALFGITAPLREFMLWRKQTDETYDIDLPEGREPVHVAMMDDFVSLGWLGYAICDYHHTGGWATPERLFAVRSAYDLDSESFKVSYLAHEGQHFADYRRFPGLAQPDLEYRAKLVEISKARTSLFDLLDAFDADGADSRETPHPWADRQVIKNLSEKLLKGEKPSAAMLKRFSVEQLNAAAVELLAEDTRQRAPKATKT